MINRYGTLDSWSTRTVRESSVIGGNSKVLYEFREEGRRDEKIKGCIVKVGEIENRDKLAEAGYQEV